MNAAAKTDAEIEAQWAAEDAALAFEVSESKRVEWIANLKTEADMQDIGGPVFMLSGAAAENAADTLIEQGQQVLDVYSYYTPAFFDLWLATVRSQINESEYAGSREWFAARGVHG